MAHVVFCNQYYFPDVASTGQHLTDLAEHLVGCGHQVTVVCSSSRYTRRGEGSGPDATGTRGTARSARAPAHEVRNGVTIRRVRGPGFGRRYALGRMADYLCFHLLAGLALLRAARRADIVVTLTTPPLLGVWGALAQAWMGVRHVAFVMDLHPDAEFELGVLRRESFTGRTLAWLDAWALRRADRCVVLGRYQGERLRAKGVVRERLAVIPIWNRADEVAPVSHAENPLRSRRGWQDRFVALYSGNAGLAHSFEEIVEAAERLQTSEPDVLFAFSGGGPRLPEVRAEAQRRGLANIVFLDYVARDELRLALAAADVHLVTLRRALAGVAVPSKVYAAMASGRPVVYVGPRRSEVAESLTAADAGLVCRPDDGVALADALARLRHDPGLCAEMGRRGRAHFLRHHEQQVCCELWREELDDLAATRVARAAAGVPTVAASGKA